RLGARGDGSLPRPAHRHGSRAGARPERIARCPAVADDPPRDEPRNAASQRGGRDPDRARALARRLGPDRLRNGGRGPAMTVMDLVAGDPREIVLTLAVDDQAALED